MKVFRLSRKKYPAELSGKGAAAFGARWNSQGIEMIYTAESRALAMAEVFVHLSLAMMPHDYQMLTIDIPEPVSVKVLDCDTLPDNWSESPYNFKTQKIGDCFIAAREACVLKVPSSVVQGDFNYLINPYHTDFSQISIVEIIDFVFDRRLIK
ncbi:MAG: RES family NAD+ phosphorylase [Lentimicrobium sp.]